MDRSRFLAGLIGPVFLAMSAAILLNRDELPAMVRGLAGDHLIVIFAGMVIFVAGLAIVRAHPIWRGWPVIVTLLGWLGILGGLARMFFPGLLIQEAGTMLASPIAVPLAVPIAVTVLAALGLFLTWQGYRPRRPEMSR